MADATTQPERLAIANALVAQAPPGELADVLNGVQALFDNDDIFKDGIDEGIKRYNLDQFAAVAVSWGDYKTLLCEPGRILTIAAAFLEGDSATEEAQPAPERFLDPRAHKAFVVNHRTLEASDPEDVEPGTNEALRKDLQTHLDAYVEGRYPRGVSAVFDKGEEGLHLIIVDSKYNPDSFWNGRWRSHWHWRPAAGKLTGRVQAAVHYYEDGNVQLNTEHDIELDVPESTKPEAVIKAISKAENERHRALHDGYLEMADNAFGALRRALPKSKVKMNWSRIDNYKVTAEMFGGK